MPLAETGNNTLVQGSLCDLSSPIAPEALPAIADQVRHEFPLRNCDYTALGEEHAKVAEVSALRRIVDELSRPDGELSTDARTYISQGGSIDIALAQIQALRPPEAISEATRQLNEARQVYSDELMARRGMFHFGRRKRLGEAAEAYTSALAVKIEETSDLHCAQCDPTTDPEDTLTMEALVERGLNILTRTLLEEQATLQQQVEAAREGALLSRLATNPRLYQGVLLSLLGISIAKNSGVLPETGESEMIVHSAEVGVTSLAAYGFAGAMQKRLLKSGASRWASKQLVRNEAMIRDDEAVADDIIERTADGAPDTIEKRAASLLAGRIFSNHLEKIKGMVSRRPEEIYDEYVELVEMVTSKEIGRFNRSATSSIKRAMLIHGLAIVSAILAGPAIVGLAAEPMAATRDLEETFKG